MKTKQSQRKASQRAALRDRLARAQADIYGNARTPWGDDVDGFMSFGDWLGDYAEREAEYMTTENFGMTERETARAALSTWSPAWCRLIAAQRETPAYEGERATTRATVNFGFPAGEWERAHAVLILDAHDTLTKEATRRNGKRYREGTCYSYGRNGKTFYPAAFANENGRGFSLRDLSELNYEAATRAAQFLEQFNACVRSIAADARNVYRDEARDALQETIAECHHGMKTARAAYHTLACELRTLRGTVAPTACDILRARLRNLAESVAGNARLIADMRATLRSMPA